MKVCLYHASNSHDDESGFGLCGHGEPPFKIHCRGQDFYHRCPFYVEIESRNEAYQEYNREYYELVERMACYYNVI